MAIKKYKLNVFKDIIIIEDTTRHINIIETRTHYNIFNNYYLMVSRYFIYS